ncbi:methyltransferase domain-containing protein [Streptomyces anulatus]|uniref:methyltransferase domain-containing protein n=1 Tax=Streptomyces anulatus TaxID=1892 RepID=UPI003423EECA
MEWQRWADTNVPIVTQWDDGHHTGLAHGELATSSSSMPSAVFAMFRDLSVVEGARVLEIGTGTGWCAGLLSARLGDRNVVSVEVDETVAETARKALAAAGWHPEVVTGDGLLIPGCVYTYGRSPRGKQTMWLFGLTDLSWAVAFFNEDDPARSNVYQGGPRSLWDELEAAHRWWSERGRPGHEEFGLTVTADGRQEIWLREPSTLVPRAVPVR